MTIKKRKNTKTAFKKIALVLLSLVLFLSACSVKLETQTDINNEFAGKKTIIITVTQSSMQNINGGKEAFTKFMANASRGPLTVSLLDEDDVNIRYQAEYSFVNLDDYINKSQEIINLSPTNVEEKKEASASYLSEDSIYSKGYSFKDNVDSQLLLQYLLDDLKAQGLVTDKSSLTANTEYKVTIDGEVIVEKSSYSPVEKEDIIFYGPQKIVLTTYAGDDGTWNRNFLMTFRKKDGMDNKSSVWIEAMEKETGLKVIGDPVDSAEEKTYRFQITNESLDKIAETTGKLLNCQDTLNLNFGINDNGNIEFTYSENLTNFVYEDQMELNYICYPDKAEDSEVDQLGESDLALTGFLKDGENKKSTSFPAGMESIDVKSELKSDGSISRELNIVKGSDSISALTANMFEKMLKDNSVDYETTDTGYKISYSGNAFDIKNSIFFVSNPKITVEKEGMFKSYINLEEYMQTKLNFDNFSASYELPNSAKIISSSLNDGRVVDGYVSLQLETTNTLKMIIFLGVGLVIVALIVLLIIKIVKAQKKKGPQPPYGDYRPNQNSRPPVGPTGSSSLTRPGQAGPSPGPSGAKPGQGGASLTRPGQAGPTQTGPGQSRPGQNYPGRAEPAEAKPGQAGYGRPNHYGSARDQGVTGEEDIL